MQLIYTLSVICLLSNQLPAANAHMPLFDEKQTVSILNSLRIEHQEYLAELKKKEQISQHHKKEKYHTVVEENITKPAKKTLSLAAKKKNIIHKTETTGKIAHNHPILTVKVKISKQRIYVYQHNKLLYQWKISTGKRGHYTPTGIFKPLRLCKHYRSRKYHNAPMPYSVFFANGYAFHGTNSIRRLGHKASHGCVRLHPSHAKTLFSLVKRIGMDHTRIHIFH